MMRDRSHRKRDTHVAFEAIAVGLLVPFNLWLASRKRVLTDRESAGLIMVAAGTLVVDGLLLASYLRKKSLR
jgi:hypothetical protein